MQRRYEFDFADVKKVVGEKNQQRNSAMGGTLTTYEMKTRALFFYLLLAIAFLWHGCIDDKKNDNASNDLSVIEAQYGPLKDYILFNVGTYWIYKDKNGNMDSMYVFASSQGNNNGYDYMETKIHSTFDSYNYYISWNTSWTSYNPRRDKVFMDKTKPGDYVGQIILMEYPPKVGNKLGWSSSSIITTANYFVNLLVDSLSFNSVIEMNVTNDITNSYYQTTNYFIAKNTGIIKEELLDSNNVWTLVRCHIVQ